MKPFFLGSVCVAVAVWGLLVPAFAPAQLDEAEYKTLRTRMIKVGRGHGKVLAACPRVKLESFLKALEKNAYRHGASPEQWRSLHGSYQRNYQQYKAAFASKAAPCSPKEEKLVQRIMNNAATMINRAGDKDFKPKLSAMSAHAKPRPKERPGVWTSKQKAKP